MSYIKRVLLLALYFLSLTFAFRYYMLVALADDIVETRWVTQPETEHAVLIACSLALVLGLVAASAHRRATDIFLLLHLMFPIYPMLVIYMFRAANTQYMVFACLMYLVVFAIAKVPLPALASGGFVRLRNLPAGVPSWRSYDTKRAACENVCTYSRKNGVTRKPVKAGAHIFSNARPLSIER